MIYIDCDEQKITLKGDIQTVFVECMVCLNGLYNYAKEDEKEWIRRVATECIIDKESKAYVFRDASKED